MKIAVIAVHGVADQQPRETANTVANLLLHMGPDDAPPRYSNFKTHELRIPHRPVRLVQPAPALSGDESENCQHQFLRGQLEQYREPDPAATYDTIRNEGVRHGNAPGAEREVHIYEMYWADLSRLGNSFLTFFVELYQLLFHLCTVGAKTARFAKEQHEDIFAWRAFSKCIQYASHCIRLPIPIANLFVLALVALAASAEIPADTIVVRKLIIGVFCIGLALYVARRLRKLVEAVLWPYVLPTVAIIAGGLWLGIEPILTANGSLHLLHLEVWIVLLVLLWAILKRYNKRHPHAKLWGIVIGTIATLLLAYSLWRNPDVIDACQWCGHQLLKGLGYIWALVIVMAFAGCGVGWRAIKRTPPESRNSARRAVFTANLITSLTGFVMLVINIALWGLVASGLQQVLPAGKFPALTKIAKSIQEHLSTTTILPGMATLLIIMAVATLWAVWSLIPAVGAEVDTPPPEERSSRWIGQSLTTAFRAMTWSGYIGIACFSVLLFAAVFLSVGGNPIAYLKQWDQPAAGELFKSFSWLILLFLVAPFFLKGFLVKISAGFRQGLDVALDVINYLREHPADSTIRAQIFARYVSLLRSVCNWKSPLDKEGYDRIIIFAHSQGTIITVDLLRFLKVEPDPELNALAAAQSIQLFTMGCPLRQLYGLRFPHLYDWARHPGAPLPDQTLPPDQRPDPTRLLSVVQWVNAYRSGDYVGRNLWRSEKDKVVYALPDVISEDAAGTRREFCIGGGAHTHYWDKTALPIVEELDRLIATA